jgi:ferritin-like metal-binding protein YciE
MAVGEKMPILKDMLADQLKTLLVIHEQQIAWGNRQQWPAVDPALLETAQRYADESRSHLGLVEKAMRYLGSSGTGFKSYGVRPLLEEARYFTEHYRDDRAKAVALITTLQKIDCYEITCYKTAQSMALALGLRDIASLLGQAASEGQRRTDFLTKFSISTLRQISSGSSAEEEV